MLCDPTSPKPSQSSVNYCFFTSHFVPLILTSTVLILSSRFINERIEAAVMSRIKTTIRSSAAEEASQSEDLSNVSPDHFSRYMDPSVTGVELVQLKNEQQKNSKKKSATDKQHVKELSKDPLLSMDTRSSRSWNSFPSTSKIGDGSKDPQGHRGGEGWGDVLDMGLVLILPRVNWHTVYII